MAEQKPFLKDMLDVDTKSALCEVVALIGAQGESANYSSEVQSQVEDAPITRLASTILQCAIKEKASDIHIEPEKQTIRVRFRIDGNMHEVMQMPGYITAPLIRRYKILADVNIIEYRVPQQGRIGARYDGDEYNLRCNILPTLHGEKIVMRISASSGAKLYMNQVGFTPEMQADIEELLFWRPGMVLIAGANGQGKTTTQYTLLNRVNSADKSIFAVAPDYEYMLPGIMQSTLNSRIGYTAEVALASIANLDAQVVALDRCRTKEATQLALRMAAENVLVLQTLTAPNAFSALQFLMTNAQPELIAEGLSGILAQTLVRRLCSNCKEHYEVTARDLRRFGYNAPDPSEKVQIARGRGCEICRDTGYRGRMGLFEFAMLDADMAEMVVRRAPLTDLKKAAKANGMKELREDGLIKVLQGLTTPEEVERAVPIRNVNGRLQRN